MCFVWTPYLPEEHATSTRRLVPLEQISLYVFDTGRVLSHHNPTPSSRGGWRRLGT
jgi:hypothetical protein